MAMSTLLHLFYSWNHNYRGTVAFLRGTRQMEEKDERYFLRVAVRSRDPFIS